MCAAHWSLAGSCEPIPRHNTNELRVLVHSGDVIQEKKNTFLWIHFRNIKLPPTLSVYNTESCNWLCLQQEASSQQLYSFMGGNLVTITKWPLGENDKQEWWLPYTAHIIHPWASYHATLMENNQTKNGNKLLWINQQTCQTVFFLKINAKWVNSASVSAANDARMDTPPHYWLVSAKQFDLTRNQLTWTHVRMNRLNMMVIESDCNIRSKTNNYCKW